MSDRVIDRLGHDSIDRAAIVTAVAQNSLKRGDISGIRKQLAPRLKIIEETRAVPWIEICGNYDWHLMMNPPIVSWSQWVGGVEQRIIRSEREKDRPTERKSDV